MEVSFDVSREAALIIGGIVKRAEKMAKAHGIKVDRLSMHMDLTPCRANGCPLKFNALAEADDVNFAHDVFGISRHIDRTTGKLGDCFLPRFHA